MITKTWQEIEAAAKKGLPLLFPIGVIEEHGPHLPLGCDIYWSSHMCRLVQEALQRKGQESLLVPPYHWGVNFCTGGFPGSFSLKPETMTQVLFEIFENLKKFGFLEVYCFNYHGDSYHIGAIVEAAKRANSELGMQVRLVLESMDLQIHGWQGNEEFLLVSEPAYPPEWFEEQEPSELGRFDIHGGAFETAVVHHFCPEQVDLEQAKALPSTSLTMEDLEQWLQGGEVMKELLPLGYAGNPAGYEAVGKHVEEMLKLQSEDIAERILHGNGEQ